MRPKAAPPAGVELRPPKNLVATRVDVGGERLVVFEWSAAPPTIDASELTASERCIVEAILRGLSNAAIAAERGTSRNTVVNQVGSVFRKLGVRSRSELLARWAKTAARPVDR